MNAQLPLTTEPINLGRLFVVELQGTQAFYQAGVRLEKMLADFVAAGFEPYGDWDGLLRYLKGFPAVLHRYLDMANRVVGLMYYTDVQAAWETGAFAGNWKPLNAEYLAWKISQGLDRRMLVQTGRALASLGMQLPERLAVLVGVTATEEGLEYMLVQEFGSRDGRIPPRALFAATFEANADHYAATYVRFIDAALLSKPLPAAVSA